ncbi:MAG: S-adenosylmethionine:tRNA ribosyltransferase-isomerase [Bacteroidetes bacterium]|nr:S-adenosylmethionine:tRNA ribosyltransferase-isomerase [Bacteroidota bacterium]
MSDSKYATGPQETAAIAIEAYHYPLPDQQIAAFPLPERDQSRLLLYKAGSISEKLYCDLPSELPPSTLLVFNQTKVIPARLQLQKPSGGWIEIFCLEPADDTDPARALMATGSTTWKCLVGGAAKWKAGQVLEKRLPLGSLLQHPTGTAKAGIANDTAAADDELLLQAAMLERRPGHFLIQFRWTPPLLRFADVLESAGAMPIPPYLKREATSVDHDRYQTVYAKEEGSVAAPTAGLHFTASLLENLRQKNIEEAFVTLHVGAGTFKPVQTDTIGDHDMHAEWIEINLDALRQIKAAHGNIVAVGTTSLRTLESLYWIGCKLIKEPNNALDDLFISQWEAYSIEANTNDASITVSIALEAIEKRLLAENRTQLSARTQIMMAPGYKARMIKGLITNFHQPKSTLLLLVASLIGDDWKKVYQYALDNNFRFLSYGDGSLLWL